MNNALKSFADRLAKIRKTKIWRFLRNTNFSIGIILTTVLFLTVIFAPVTAPYSPVKQTPKDRLQAPSNKYWMGTDEFGRDITSRIIYGGANSMRISIVSVLLASCLGTLLGVICAYMEGKTDYVIMRVMDLLFAFPTILLALAIAAALGPSFVNTVIAISIVYTPIFTRVARGSVLHIKEMEYVTASTSLGATAWYKILHHILPNAIAPTIIQVSMAFSWAILTESTLSYLGLGTQPPAPSWGGMISESRRLMEIAPWMAIFPGLAIMITVLSFNSLGDGLRDILDPRTSSRKT